MGNWRKSTYSDASGGQCVELASDGTAVLVRDTTNCTGATLSFPPAVWKRFANSLRRAFDESALV
jgi:hypothetical protein